MVIHPSNKTLVTKWNGYSTCRNISQRYFAVSKRPMSKSYILYHSMHTTISKETKSRAMKNRLVIAQRLRVGEACNHKGIG